MIKFKATLLVLFCLVVNNLFAQDYYINLKGDTIKCTILRNELKGLRVKAKKREWVKAEDILEYSRVSLSYSGPIFRQKKFNDGKEDEYLLLPGENKTGSYMIYEGDVGVLSDGTTTFYQVYTAEGDVLNGGLDIELDLYIENKEGFSILDYGSRSAKKRRRDEIIKTLRQYLGSNESVMAKLTDEANADLRRKAIIKLMEEYFNQKMPK